MFDSVDDGFQDLFRRFSRHQILAVRESLRGPESPRSMIHVIPRSSASLDIRSPLREMMHHSADLTDESNTERHLRTVAERLILSSPNSQPGNIHITASSRSSARP